MKYTEILKLKRMLEEANIPFEFTDDFWNVKRLEELVKVSIRLLRRLLYHLDYLLSFSHRCSPFYKCLFYARSNT